MPRIQCAEATTAATNISVAHWQSQHRNLSRLGSSKFPVENVDLLQAVSVCVLSYDCGPEPAYPSIRKTYHSPCRSSGARKSTQWVLLVARALIRRESFQSPTQVATVLTGWGPQSQPCQKRQASH
jgi:hypothetical protein